MGDSITEGVVLEWLKKPGQAVAADEVVVLLETDKITVEVRAPSAGVFEEALHPESAVVGVGAQLFKFKPGAAASEPSKESAKESAKEAPKSESKQESPKQESTPAKASGEKVTVPVPTLTETISNGLVKEILVKPGQGVKADEVILAIETDKITVEVRTPVAGVIDSVLVKVGQDVKVGEELVKVIKGSAPAEAAKPAEKAPEKASAAAPAPQSSSPKPAEKSSKPASPAASRPVASSSGAVERIDTRQRMSMARKRTAQRLKDSQNTAAILTTFNEVDMHNLMEMRERYKDRFLERFGVKLGFMSAFAKASAIALQENPVVNAVMDGDDIIYRNYVDISVAVSTPTSLVVPVLRNVERMSFADIERTIGEFGVKAKEGKLSLEEMSGGTFTISNGGVFGSLMGTPIINPPQSAILGMHAINKRPHVVGDKIEIRPLMYIALSYDHRIIDGRDAVTTLKRIKTLIEDPVAMLLDL
jgi:2-oxoglutarate dehydrogenase E2 component (dihydrolipoamide succinyltransferase)